MSKTDIHKYISWVKSAIRIGGYLLLFNGEVEKAAVVLVISEGLGILEEVAGA